MSRIAGTGAGGFIRGALVRRLAADGHAVVGVDVDPRGAAGLDAVGGDFRHADVTNTAAVFGAVAGVDAVVHASLNAPLKLAAPYPPAPWTSSTPMRPSTCTGAAGS
jgi:nucleoside-diphosphate-sugar epimerase